MILDDKRPINRNSSVNGPGFLIWMLIFFLCWYSMFTVSPKEQIELKTEKYDSVEIGRIEEDCILRCLGYTPIFEENGTKNYEVRFRVDILNIMVKCIVPAKEIDELHNIEEDAKYKGTVEFAYFKNYVDNFIKELEGKEKEDFIKKFLQSNSEYREVANISFMYSEYLSDYSFEHAQMVLIDRWQKKD